jgi:hypothetical protein
MKVTTLATHQTVNPALPLAERQPWFGALRYRANAATPLKRCVRALPLAALTQHNAPITPQRTIVGHVVIGRSRGRK